MLQKLKDKKYGSGKNMSKAEQLISDVRKIFNVCEKYYSYDSTSIRISRTLESYFENELSKANKAMNAQDSSTISATQKPGTLDKSKRPNRGSKMEIYSEDFERSLSSSSYKQKKKKDKKKDKSKKKKKKAKKFEDDSDENDQTSIGNVENGIDLNEEIEKGDAFGSNSANMVQRQTLYNNIMKYLSST